jgi:hypothetical protein
MPGYKLASNYCHKKYLKGGICIFIKKDILYQAINLRKLCRERQPMFLLDLWTLLLLCREKTFEMCAVKLQIISTKMIILCIYRAHLAI